jgi:N utilization substance protein B
MRHPLRHHARRFALQALYQWHITKLDLIAIEEQFYVDHIKSKKIDREYFHELLFSVPQTLSKIDESIQSHSKRRLKEVDPVELSILRIAIYELMTHPEIPYKVIINEALELAKTFGAADGFKFVNGLLDNAAISLRPIETHK